MTVGQFEILVAALTKAIQDSYESGVTMDEAEKLAAKFLYAQMQVAEKLQAKDLDARMKKTGVKAIKAGIYMDCATKGERKPTEAMLGAMVDQTTEVIKAQDDLDESEVKRNELERYFEIFKDAHIYFRTVARGRFE